MIKCISSQTYLLKRQLAFRLNIVVEVINMMMKDVKLENLFKVICVDNIFLKEKAFDISGFFFATKFPSEEGNFHSIACGAAIDITSLCFYSTTFESFSLYHHQKTISTHSSKFLQRESIRSNRIALSDYFNMSKPTVIVIGAGPSGIAMMYNLKVQAGIDSFTVYEEVCSWSFRR